LRLTIRLITTEAAWAVKAEAPTAIHCRRRCLSRVHPSAESPIQPSACSPRWLSPRAAGNTPGASKATFWMLSKMCDSAVLNLFRLLKDLPPRFTRSQLWQSLAVDAAHIVEVFFNLAQQFPGLLYQITC